MRERELEREVREILRRERVQREILKRETSKREKA